MKPIRHLLGLLAAVLLLSPLLSGAGIDYLKTVAASPTPAEGGTYYTRYNLMYEKGVHPTTNYWRGTLLPINSRVTIISLGHSKIQLRLEEGGSIVTIKNVKEYSQRDTATIARELLGAEPVALDRLPEAEAAMVRDGYPRRGMTKEEVLMARGYPPRHKTPNLESNRWQYWTSRFVVQTLVFENGILVEGRGT